MRMTFKTPSSCIRETLKKRPKVSPTMGKQTKHMQNEQVYGGNKHLKLVGTKKKTLEIYLYHSQLNLSTSL